MILSRRRLFVAGAVFLAAPSIVRASSLMPISAPKIVMAPNHWVVTAVSGAEAFDAYNPALDATSAWIGLRSLNIGDIITVS